MKWQYNLIITQIVHPISVRNYLSKHLLIPKHLIFQLRKHNRVLINQKYLPMNFMVHYHDHLTLSFVPADFKHPFPQVIPDHRVLLSTVFENNDLMVVNKPKGYKTHPNQPHETGTILNFAAAKLQPHQQLPYIVHRLDMETSGALIIAKNPAVVPILVRLIADKRIKRSYLTWVKGTGFPAHGQINQPIGYDPNDQRKRMINGIQSQNAITDYQVLKTKNHQTLLKVVLKTGRTHQIRVHLASIGHPIIGDPLYNPDSYETPHPNMRLHSWIVKLILPFQMKSIKLVCPPPKQFNIM